MWQVLCRDILETGHWCREVMKGRVCSSKILKIYVYGRTIIVIDNDGVHQGQLDKIYVHRYMPTNFIIVCSLQNPPVLRVLSDE